MSNKKKPRNTQTTKVRPADQGHINALQAEIDRLEAMTTVGQRRVFASFPELEYLFECCAWLISIVDPTAGRTYGTIGRTSIDATNNVDAMLAAGDRVEWFVGKQQWLNDELKLLNENLAGKIEATEHDRYKATPPVCITSGCEVKGLPQAFDSRFCRQCGTELR